MWQKLAWAAWLVATLSLSATCSSAGHLLWQRAHSSHSSACGARRAPHLLAALCFSFTTSSTYWMPLPVYGLGVRMPRTSAATRCTSSSCRP